MSEIIEKLQITIIVMTVCAMLATFFWFMFQTVQANNVQFYKAQSECVTTGGSWIGNAGGSPLCLRK